MQIIRYIPNRLYDQIYFNLAISFLMLFHNPSSQFRYLPQFSQIIAYNPRTYFHIGGEAKTCKDYEALPFKDSYLKLGGLCPQLHSMAA